MSTRRNALSNITLAKTPNPHTELWLDKYITDQKKDANNRAPFIAEVSALPMPEAYPAFYKRWEQMLEDQGAKKRTARVKGRMIIGLGDESVLETAITLHRTYGVPYIPGSALKGLATTYARQRLGEAWQKDSEAYKIIFGNTDDTGYITFFDALYIPGTGHKHNGKAQALYPDVITVHHQKYYQDPNNPPADWDDPIPVPFLTATGSYLIALAGSELEEQEVWIEATFAILEHALAELGIGAKTSSGYGRMELKRTVDLSSPDMQAALRLKEEIDKMPDGEVSRRMQSYFPKWRDMPSDETRMIVAKAIIEKVQNAGVERTLAGQAWYKVLLTRPAGR